jgi:hypothetical protein
MRITKQRARKPILDAPITGMGAGSSVHKPGYHISFSGYDADGKFIRVSLSIDELDKLTAFANEHRATYTAYTA